MKKYLCRYALLPICLAMNVAAVAASIHVKPTTVILGPGQNAAAITITNEGDKPLNAQVRVFGWDQQDGKDVLGATSNLVASPPATALAPKQSQSIRLVRTAKTPATAEEAYRLVVDELPDKSNLPTVGVELQMRYSMPVFVQPKTASKQDQVTVTAQLSGNTLTVNAQNQGQLHAQASNLAVVYAGGAAVSVINGLVGYVLPGKTMQWTANLPADAAAKGKPAHVTVLFNGQSFSVDL